MSMKEDPTDVKIALSLIAGIWMFAAIVTVKTTRLVVRRSVARVRTTKELPA